MCPPSVKWHSGFYSKRVPASESIPDLVRYQLVECLITPPVKRDTATSLSFADPFSVLGAHLGSGAVHSSLEGGAGGTAKQAGWGLDIRSLPNDVESTTAFASPALAYLSVSVRRGGRPLCMQQPNAEPDVYGASELGRPCSSRLHVGRHFPEAVHIRSDIAGAHHHHWIRGFSCYQLPESPSDDGWLTLVSALGYRISRLACFSTLEFTCSVASSVLPRHLIPTTYNTQGPSHLYRFLVS